MSGVEQADYISRRMWLVGIMHLTWVCPGSIPSPAVPIRPCIVAVLGPRRQIVGYGTANSTFFGLRVLY